MIHPHRPAPAFCLQFSHCPPVPASSSPLHLHQMPPARNEDGECDCNAWRSVCISNSCTPGSCDHPPTTSLDLRDCTCCGQKNISWDPLVFHLPTILDHVKGVYVPCQDNLNVFPSRMPCRGYGRWSGSECTIGRDAEAVLLQRYLNKETMVCFSP